MRGIAQILCVIMALVGLYLLAIGLDGIGRSKGGDQMIASGVFLGFALLGMIQLGKD